MNAKLKTFSCGSGDCIFFILSNEDNKYVIMVDCGKYTDEIRSFIESDLHKHINLLVLTHIDADHLNGIRQMLAWESDLQINRILFNCYQINNGNENLELADATKETIKELTQIMPLQYSSSVRQVDAKHATTVSGLIMNKKGWYEAWYKNGSITTTSKDLFLGEHWGNIHFVSPTPDNLSKLEDKVKKDYFRYLHKKFPNHDFTGKEQIFETIMLLSKEIANNYRKDKGIKAATHFDTLSEQDIINASCRECEQVSEENASSIGFVWKCNDKQVLFLGDADPEIVASHLPAEPQKYEMVKISHHGSRHSTSNRIMEVVDSHNFFFTGGNDTNKPSLEVISKIVIRHNEDVGDRILRFNRASNHLVKTLLSEKCAKLKQHYNFEVSLENEAEFEY